MAEPIDIDHQVIENMEDEYVPNWEEIAGALSKLTPELLSSADVPAAFLAELERCAKAASKGISPTFATGRFPDFAVRDLLKQHSPRRQHWVLDITLCRS